MRDYISAKQRITNPFQQWVSESMKELALSVVFFILAILLVSTSIGGTY